MFGGGPSGWLKYPKYSSPMFLFFFNHHLSPGYPVVNIQKTMENHHLLWENSLFTLFLWPCSIAILTNYQRVCLFDSFRGYGVKILRRYRVPLGGHCGPSTGPPNGSRVTIAEDPRGMFKWDSRASVSKKRHNESINQWIGLRENFNRIAPYKTWENLWFPVNFPLNQSIESMIQKRLQ